MLEEDSPYFEVRAAVRNYDEDLPANTIRAWVIGMIATTIVSAVNLLFSLRNPSITIYVYVVQLLAYPVGCGLARVSHSRETFFFFCWGGGGGVDLSSSPPVFRKGKKVLT